MTFAAFDYEFLIVWKDKLEADSGEAAKAVITACHHRLVYSSKHRSHDAHLALTTKAWEHFALSSKHATAAHL